VALTCNGLSAPGMIRTCDTGFCISRVSLVLVTARKSPASSQDWCRQFSVIPAVDR
jgi:hypothetical protein